jgi:hypothetical protein
MGVELSSRLEMKITPPVATARWFTICYTDTTLPIPRRSTLA